MASLDQFSDFFVESTGPAFFSGPDHIVNAAQLRNYEISGRFFNSKQNVQGGNQIKETIFFDTPGTAHTYDPGETATILNTQGLKTITVNWRRIRDYVTANESELDLNEGGGRDAMFHQFARLRATKLDRMWTGLMTKVERLMVATASNADMEANSGKEPFSTFATVTSDGLAPAGFTTVQSLNPTTHANYRNQTASYTAATPFDIDNGIIGGFDNMQLLVRFKPPTMQVNRFENTDLSKHVIWTNREGKRDYKKAVSFRNDIQPNGKDPAFETVYDGVPVEAPDVLDDQSKFTSGSPDYLFINMEHLKWISHSKHFFEIGRGMRDSRTPDTEVFWVDLWGNLINTNRRAHGYLAGA